MKMSRILLVEDDETILFALRSALFREGYEILAAGSLAGAEKLAGENPDLIVLDLGLPDGEGLCFLRECREAEGPPVIILTARDGEADIIRGLDMGADDYVTKPFKLGVLLSRIRRPCAVHSRMKRGRRQQQSSLYAGMCSWIKRKPGYRREEKKSF